MKTRIALYGALREADPGGYVELDIADDCTVAALRDSLVDHLSRHAPAISEGLIRRSAFATSDTILHDRQPVPDGKELAVLPPVGGG